MAEAARTEVNADSTRIMLIGEQVNVAVAAVPQARIPIPTGQALAWGPSAAYESAGSFLFQTYQYALAVFTSIARPRPGDHAADHPADRWWRRHLWLARG